MPYSNPVVGGNTLIREAIQSPNYVAGTTGWTINRDGSVEFNNGTFRGSIDVGGPTPPNGSAHVGDLAAYAYPGFYGIGATDDNEDSQVLLGAGGYAVVALGAPYPTASFYGEIKGELRGSGHPSTTVIAPGDSAVAPAFATLWLEGNTLADPTAFETELYTSVFNITSNRMNLNGRGILRDGDSTSERQLAFKSATTVASTNASGIVTINPGFTTLVGFVPWVGDGTSASYTLGNQRSGWPVSGNSVDIHVRLSTTAANVVSTLVRIDWIAIGVL